MYEKKSENSLISALNDNNALFVHLVTPIYARHIHQK